MTGEWLNSNWLLSGLQQGLPYTETPCPVTKEKAYVYTYTASASVLYSATTLPLSTTLSMSDRTFYDDSNALYLHYLIW